MWNQQLDFDRESCFLKKQTSLKWSVVETITVELNKMKIGGNKLLGNLEMVANRRGV